MNDPVDVLIIGAGASGAAVAWSLADTRMHILCLEQGGWMNPETYPSDPARRAAVAMELRAKGGAAVATLTRVVLQCYYRDDRVVRSLRLEPRPPYPKGHVLEDGDWSLLDPVRARPPLWRRA
jgi:choline dehydrogenase-like flavoprotein